MSSLTTKEWVLFFNAAGIPTQAATSYALTFSENRIQKNMLLDLNKEYLKDMGISLMGDVIAILKHAKVAHEEFARERMLGHKEEVKNIVDESLPKISPVKRILNHYTRKYEAEKIEPDEIVEITFDNETKSKKPPKTLKRKVEPPSVEKTEESAPKVRKMINLKGKKLQKTVFDRLGEGCVTSTSTSNTTTPKPTLQGPVANVFSRLGNKANSVPLVSSSTVDHGEEPSSESLQYAGILKPPIKQVVGLSLKRRLGGITPKVTTSKLQQGDILKQQKQQLTSSAESLEVSSLSSRFGTTKKKTFDNFVVKPKTKISRSEATSTTIPSKPTRISIDEDLAHKKVRFGKTTHRLIPGNTDLTNQNKFKNIKDLRMQISNLSTNSKCLSSGIRVGGLNSDMTLNKSVKERIELRSTTKLPAKLRLGGK